MDYGYPSRCDRNNGFCSQGAVDRCITPVVVHVSRPVPAVS
jgi:hypothetical protein